VTCDAALKLSKVGSGAGLSGMAGKYTLPILWVLELLAITF